MFFSKAVPVFPTGKEKEMNLQTGYAVRLPKCEDAVLYLAGCSFYSVFINGQFIHYGPARACLGKFRVDSIAIGAYLVKPDNILTVHLSTYNCNTFIGCTMYPGFIQAEVRSGEDVLAYTAEDGNISAYILTERVQKVPRYCFQRGFMEVYKLDEVLASFDTDPEHSGHERAVLSRRPAQTLLQRGLYDPSFPCISDIRLHSKGKISLNESFDAASVFMYKPSDSFFCFAPEECETNSLTEYMALNQTEPVPEASGAPWNISAEEYRIFTLPQELTGLISLEITAHETCEIYVAFDEFLQNERVNFVRAGSCNLIKYTLAPGHYKLLSAEPYVLSCFEVAARGGSITLHSAALVRIGYPEIATKLNSADVAEQKIYAAAVESFRQNSFDVYMDCPGRERAGWLCDSYFTSRSEYALTGKSLVEKNFIENFIEADSFPGLPDGILPMCYPSDHPNGCYIPNWAMWFVLELKEYLARTGDRALVDRAKPRVLSLVKFFEQFRNGDGLLEKLQSWVFLEWSKANDLVQDVNFPSNALYAGMLSTVAELYELPEYAAQAERIRDYIRKNTLKGDFFCDNAIRGEDGSLTLSGECTEVCQYYMFYFDVATPEKNPELWRILKDEFGPDRVKKGIHPEIYPANAFIGNYLRLDYLARRGLYDQLLSEINGYFLYMAEKTGTLWEGITDSASCNHGFASHAAVWLLAARGTK